MLTPSPFPILPLARSLTDNELGEDGAWTLGYNFKKTKITNLGCANALSDRDCVSAPADTAAFIVPPQARWQRLC